MEKTMVAIDKELDKDFNGFQGMLGMLGPVAMGGTVLALLPLWVGGLTSIGRFSREQIGFLAAADLAGVFSVTIILFFLVRHIHWKKTTCICLTLCIIANLVSCYLVEFWPLLMTRFIAGMSLGCCYSIGLAALGETKDPARSYGMMITSQVALGSLGLFILPQFIQTYSVASIFVFFILGCAISLIFSLRKYPTRRIRKQTKHVSNTKSNSFKPLLLVLFGTFIFNIAQGAAWGYMELVGLETGMSVTTVGNVLGFGYMFSLLGSMLATKVGTRKGYVIPFVTSGIIMISSLLLLTNLSVSNIGIILFIGANIIYQLLWSYIVPYQISSFNEKDKSGRFVVLFLTTNKAGVALGPVLAAFLLSGEGFKPVLYLGASCLFISSLFFVMSALKTKPSINN